MDTKLRSSCSRYMYTVHLSTHVCVLHKYTGYYMLQDHDRDSAKGEKPTEGLALVQILSLQDAPLRRRSDRICMCNIRICMSLSHTLQDAPLRRRSDPSLTHIRIRILHIRIVDIHIVGLIPLSHTYTCTNRSLFRIHERIHVLSAGTEGVSAVE